MVANYEEATNAKDTKNGIRINGCSVDIGYTDNQLVVRADLELLYMVLDKITIEADRTSIEVCGGETNVCVTGHFHLVTKTEDDSSDGSSITDTTILATWSDDADSAGPSTCTVISFDENKIGGTDEITADPSDQPERSETTTATYTYKGTNLTSDNDTEKTSNTVTVTQAANILGEWYKETSLDRNFSITPSCPGIVSENGGTATATSTVTYEYCEERKDSCDHIVGRKWTTTTITGPSGSVSFDEQECDADERSQTISLVYTHVNGASVSTTCTATQEASSVPCYCGQVCSDVGCSGKIHWLCAEKKGDTEYEYDCSTAKITNLVDGKLPASGGTATVTVEGNSKKGIWTKSAYCGYETLPTEIVTSLPSLSNVESSQDKVYLIVDQEGKTGGTLYYTDSNGDTQSTYSYTYTSYTWYHYTVWPEDVTIGKKTIKEEKWGWKSGTVYVKHANSASSYGWKSYTYRCNSAVSCDAKREEFVNDGNSESTWDSSYETWYDKWLTYQASEKFFCDGVEVPSEEEMLNCEGEQNRYLDESLNPGEFSVRGEYWGASTVYGENENYYGISSMYLCCVRNISTETDYLVDHLSDKTPITSNTSFTYAANTSSSDKTGTATVTLNGGYTCQVPYTVAAGTSGTPCMTINYTLSQGAAGIVYFKTTNGTQQGSHEVDATGSQALCNIAENTTLVVSHSNTAVTVGGDTSFVYKSGTTANISLTIVGGGETITNNCASVSVQGRNWTVTLPKAAASDLTYKFYAVNGFYEEGNVNSGLDWEQTVSVSKGSTNGTARSTTSQFATDDSYFISVSPSEDDTYNYSDCSITIDSDWNGSSGDDDSSTTNCMSYMIGNNTSESVTIRVYTINGNYDESKTVQGDTTTDPYEICDLTEGTKINVSKTSGEGELNISSFNFKGGDEVVIEVSEIDTPTCTASNSWTGISVTNVSAGKCDTSASMTVTAKGTHTYTDCSTATTSTTLSTSNYTVKYGKSSDSYTLDNITTNETTSEVTWYYKVTASSTYGSKTATGSFTQASGKCTEDSSDCTCSVTSIIVSPTSHKFTSTTEEKSFTVTINDNDCSGCTNEFIVYGDRDLYITSGSGSFSLTNMEATLTIKSKDDNSKTCTLSLTAATESTNYTYTFTNNYKNRNIGLFISTPSGSQTSYSLLGCINGSSVDVILNSSSGMESVNGGSPKVGDTIYVYSVTSDNFWTSEGSITLVASNKSYSYGASYKNYISYSFPSVYGGYMRLDVSVNGNSLTSGYVHHACVGNESNPNYKTYIYSFDTTKYDTVSVTLYGVGYFTSCNDTAYDAKLSDTYGGDWGALPGHTTFEYVSSETMDLTCEMTAQPGADFGGGGSGGLVDPIQPQ